MVVQAQSVNRILAKDISFFSDVLLLQMDAIISDGALKFHLPCEPIQQLFFFSSFLQGLSVLPVPNRRHYSRRAVQLYFSCKLRQQSPPPRPIYFVSLQGLSEAVLIGHSMGGKAAAMTALLHPQAVRGLMVMDIAPVSYSM